MASYINSIKSRKTSSIVPVKVNPVKRTNKDKQSYVCEDIDDSLVEHVKSSQTLTYTASDKPHSELIGKLLSIKA